jgi:poly-gamma-glutamate capsule biosynthesis protein CapA/YwtB (metallophosphatase superfamily)
MIDAGADISLGTHVHAAQGIERYKGKLIVYSPGTLIGRQSPPEFKGRDIAPVLQPLLADMSPDGFITCVDIDRSGAYSVRIIPTSLDSHGLPFVATGEILDRIAARVTTWSAELDTHVSLQDGELRIIP